MQVRWARMLFVFGCGFAAAGAARAEVERARCDHPSTSWRTEIVDFDQDGRNEISAWTFSRSVFHLSFDGMVQRVARSDGGSAGDARFCLARD
jgi:predicted small metal-binding protein